MINSEIDELRDLVSIAQKETEDRLRQYSNYGPYIHAKSQLAFIKDKIEKPELVDEEDKKLINIGIMAVKELDVSDPEYARLLMKISTRFKEL
jgi:hypothetical protein